MSTYLIHGYDRLYGGSNGMEEWTIEECSEKEAINTAKDLSMSVIDSYREITDELDDRAKDYTDYDLEEGRINSWEYERRHIQYYEDNIADDIAYDIVELNDDYTYGEYWNMIESHVYDYEDIWDKFGEKEII